ncbi:unnamed protein product [Leptosia nina]|uniref:Cyclase n=1 Tax=Leptosia nina TaxID=320188 RepID=A0AAV1J4N3_9NEOP
MQKILIQSLIIYFSSVIGNPINLNGLLLPGEYEYIDLTNPFDENTIYWPGIQKFEFTKKVTIQSGNLYAANEFATAEHGGTHLDAPAHFDINGKFVADIPISKLIVPRLSGEVMEWITTSYKNVVGVGVDTSSIDPGSSTEFPAHRIGSAAGLYNIESINLSRPIQEYGCTALVMPMKISQGTGAPVRIVAICPKKPPTEF